MAVSYGYRAQPCVTRATLFHVFAWLVLRGGGAAENTTGCLPRCHSESEWFGLEGADYWYDQAKALRRGLNHGAAQRCERLAARIGGPRRTNRPPRVTVALLYQASHHTTIQDQVVLLLLLCADTANPLKVVLMARQSEARQASQMDVLSLWEEVTVLAVPDDSPLHKVHEGSLQQHLVLLRTLVRAQPGSAALVLGPGVGVSEQDACWGSPAHGLARVLDRLQTQGCYAGGGGGDSSCGHNVLGVREASAIDSCLLPLLLQNDPRLCDLKSPFQVAYPIPPRSVWNEKSPT